MKSNRSYITLFLALLMVIVLGSTGFWLHRILDTCALDLGGGDVEITIEKGMSLYKVGRLLEDQHLISDRSDFRWAAWVMRAERKIQPGRFLLPRGVSNSEIIRHLMRPGIRTVDLTIPEGLTVRQIASILSRDLEFDSAEFVNLCEDSLYAMKLGVQAGRLEGYLFPNTYNFYFESKPGEVIERMMSHLYNVFDDSTLQRIDELGFSLHQIITLASIIQGEVMIEREAPMVAAVYHNRLKKGMLLAADPTIQYIIPDAPRRLLTRDIEIDSPYNTYRRRGLPPGPVNNPGRVALLAAVYPADEDYLYFVAKGDGSHAFNYTHSGHTRDKLKFQQVRREVEREKRKARKGG